MKRELSSKLTFFAKIIIPGLVILCWSMVILGSLVSVNGRNKPPLLLVLIMGVVIIAILYFTNLKLMKVLVDNEFLYVSNYSKEIKIPLSDIADVTEIAWVRGNPVTIHLKQRSEFGRKIRLIPYSKGFSKAFQSHPVVDELKTLARIR